MDVETKLLHLTKFAKDGLEELAKRNMTNSSLEIRIAIDKHLAKNGIKKERES